MALRLAPVPGVLPRGVRLMQRHIDAGISLQAIELIEAVSNVAKDPKMARRLA